MLAVGHPPWRVVAFRRHAPDRGVISVLLVVDRDLHKGNARPVRRDLRVSDPVELKDIFLGDRALLLGKSGNRQGTDGGDGKQAAGKLHETPSQVKPKCYSTGQGKAVSLQPGSHV